MKKSSARHKRWRDANPEKVKKYHKNYAASHKKELARNKRRSYKKTKVKFTKTVMEHYGAKCVTCGEIRPEALLLHHKDGGGGEQRSKIGNGIGFLRWIIKNNFPDC